MSMVLSDFNFFFLLLRHFLMASRQSRTTNLSHSEKHPPSASWCLLHSSRSKASAAENSRFPSYLRNEILIYLLPFIFSLRECGAATIKAGGHLKLPIYLFRQPLIFHSPCGIMHGNSVPLNAPVFFHMKLRGEKIRSQDSRRQTNTNKAEEKLSAVNPFSSLRDTRRFYPTPSIFIKHDMG